MKNYVTFSNLIIYKEMHIQTMPMLDNEVERVNSDVKLIQDAYKERRRKIRREKMALEEREKEYEIMLQDQDSNLQAVAEWEK